MEKPLEPKDLLIRIMRISIMQIVLAALFVSVSYATEVSGQELLEKKVSLHMESKPLKAILARLETATGVSFIYSPKATQAERRTSLDVRDKPLGEVLDKLLNPLDIQYRQLGSQIILSPKVASQSTIEEATEGLKSVLMLDKTVTGRVTDEKGEGLPGVSIVVKGTQRGTVTNEQGTYSLSVPERLPDASPVTLIFSFVGYLSQEVVVGNRSSIDIVLAVDTKSLEEVVVVGYGTQRKSDLTGSVASVEEKDFTQGVNNSALQLLNGKASGVQISQSSSAPGGGIAIRIRGAGSINSSNEALIVVDGLPGATTTSISPDDIESIQILKDASAAAIYGSRPLTAWY